MASVGLPFAMATVGVAYGLLTLAVTVGSLWLITALYAEGKEPPGWTRAGVQFVMISSYVVLGLSLVVTAVGSWAARRYSEWQLPDEKVDVQQWLGK